MACPDGPFSFSWRPVDPETWRAITPANGWGCATMREFMGFMADSKIAAPKGQLFLTLLPFPPNRGINNAWEQVYLDARRNPGRDTLQQSAKSNSSLPEGKGSDRLIVFAVDLHMYATVVSIQCQIIRQATTLSKTTRFRCRVCLSAYRLQNGHWHDYVQYRFQVHGRAQVRHWPWPR